MVNTAISNPQFKKLFFAQLMAMNQSDSRDGLQSLLTIWENFKNPAL